MGTKRSSAKSYTTIIVFFILIFITSIALSYYLFKNTLSYTPKAAQEEKEQSIPVVFDNTNSSNPSDSNSSPENLSQPSYIRGTFYYADDFNDPETNPLQLVITLEKDGNVIDEKTFDNIISPNFYEYSFLKQYNIHNYQELNSKLIVKATIKNTKFIGNKNKVFVSYCSGLTGPRDLLNYLIYSENQYCEVSKLPASVNFGYMTYYTHKFSAKIFISGKISVPTEGLSKDLVINVFETHYSNEEKKWILGKLVSKQYFDNLGINKIEFNFVGLNPYQRYALQIMPNFLYNQLTIGILKDYETSTNYRSYPSDNNVWLVKPGAGLDVTIN